jgi:hypothetical protein
MQVVLSLKKHTHRKGANNKKCLVVFIKEFLCVLCVSAVKAVLMDGHRVFLEKQDVVGDA